MCYDIYSLEFTAEQRSVDVVAMISAEGERVPFGSHHVKARGSVEAWLSAVETAMRNALQKCFKVAIQEYEKTPRDAWIIDHAAQVCISAIYNGSSSN